MIHMSQGERDGCRQYHTGQIPAHESLNLVNSKIGVTFDIDANGIVNVSAKDLELERAADPITSSSSYGDED